MKKNILRLKYALFLSLMSMSIIACSTNFESKEKSKNKKNITEEIKEEDKEIEINYDQIVNKYLNYYDSLVRNYNGEEYYLTDQEIESIINSYNVLECSYHFDGNIDNVIENIKNNSKIFCQNNKEVYSAFYEGEVDYKIIEEHQKIFEECLKVVIENLVSHSNNNISEDICRLNTISIVYGNMDNYFASDENSNSVVLGLYDCDNNVIILDEYNIYLASKVNEEYHQYYDYYSSLLQTLTHEINHVRQDVCMHREAHLRSPLCYSFYVPTLLETSAESDIYAYDKLPVIYEKNNKDYNYESERYYESLFLIMGLVNRNKDDYYNAIFDADANELLNFVNANSDEEIKELYNILFSLDSINLRNDFLIDYYNSEYLTPSEIKSGVGFAYRLSIFDKYLTDMINYTYHFDLPVEENLAMLRIVESLLLDNIEYYIPENNSEFGSYDYVKVYDQYYIINFLNYHDTYMKFIEEYYNYSQEEIYDIYYGTSANIAINANFYIKLDRIIHKNETDEMFDIINRFPLLENILFSNKVERFNLNNIIKNRGLDLILK